MTEFVLLGFPLPSGGYIDEKLTSRHHLKPQQRQQPSNANKPRPIVFKK
jgi:hypothetical protein